MMGKCELRSFVVFAPLGTFVLLIDSFQDRGQRVDRNRF